MIKYALVLVFLHGGFWQVHEQGVYSDMLPCLIAREEEVMSLGTPINYQAFCLAFHSGPEA